MVRQGSAKSSSGVQIPSTPLQKQIINDLLFLFHFSYEKSMKKVYNQIEEKTWTDHEEFTIIICIEYLPYLCHHRGLMDSTFRPNSCFFIHRPISTIHRSIIERLVFRSHYCSRFIYPAKEQKKHPANCRTKFFRFVWIHNRRDFQILPWREIH